MMKKFPRMIQNDTNDIHIDNFMSDRGAGGKMTTIILCFLGYLTIGVWVLKVLLETRFLRPLTNKEIMNVILTWPMWL
jgi:hypothetical protein